MFVTATIALLLQAPPTEPPEWKPPAPDRLPKAVPLGLLGARGESHVAGGTIRISEVSDNTPARAGGLEPDDLIMWVNGRRLTRPIDPAYQLVDLIDKATTAKPGKEPILNLTVQRNGQPVKLKIPLPALGPHARDCQGTCERCALLTKRSLDWLAAQQLPDGSFGERWDVFSKKVSCAAVAGIAFLASGSTPEAGAYADNLRRARAYVLQNAGREYKVDGVTSMVNWPLAYGGIFLGLCHKRLPHEPSVAKLQEIAIAIATNQETNGGWGHGPGGMNGGGYIELQILGDLCLLALGICQQVGCEVAPATITKGMAYLDQRTTPEGGVNYSADPRQIKGRGEPGRTAGALVAYQALGRTGDANYRKSLDYFTARVDQLHAGHGGICMHYAAGAMVSWVEGPKAWKTYREGMAHELLLARQPDGTFAYRPSTENDDPKRAQDKVNGPIWVTANHLIIEQLPLGHLDWTP